jgi:hypothetical protein
MEKSVDIYFEPESHRPFSISERLLNIPASDGRSLTLFIIGKMWRTERHTHKYESHIWVLIHAERIIIKGTVSWDFLPSVFFQKKKNNNNTPCAPYSRAK